MHFRERIIGKNDRGKIPANQITNNFDI
jgi:hypothetical protein